MEPSSPARSSLKSKSADAKNAPKNSVKFVEAGESPVAKPSSKARSPSPSKKDGSSSSAEAGRGRSASPQRSGSPSKLFSEEDFERKRDAPDIEKRKKMAAKARGLAIEPKDWSRAELLERLNRFCRFSQDSLSGSAELKIKEGFSLSTEEVKVICELCRRVNEIQVVDMSACGATDDHMQVIVHEGFKNLRHLRQLYLSRNQLSSSTTTTLCGHFSRLYRKLEVLDLRDNSAMTFDDGSRLYNAFLGIHTFNGLDIHLFRSDEENRTSYDFSGRDLRIMEVGIICGLIGHMSGIRSINLRSNRITAKGMHYLLDTVKKYPRVASLDVSFNPVTNEGIDMSAMERLLHFVQKRTHLTYVGLEGIVMPDTLKERIELSLSVNRSIEGSADGYHFNRYLEKLIISKAKPSSLSDIEHWQPRLDELDETFIRSNRLPVCMVAPTNTGFTMAWREQPREFTPTS